MQTQSQTGTPGSARWKGLGVRVAAASIMIPCVLAVTWVGGIWFVAMIAVVGIAAAAEWARIVHGGSKIQFALHAAAVLIATLFSLRYSMLSGAALIAFIWSASLMVSGATQTRINLWTFFSVPYIALPMAACVHLRLAPDYGLLAVLWIFLTVWLADTLAYAFGRSIGGPRLAPKLSPNKTWAGLAGAVVGAAIGSVIIAWWGGLSGVVPLIVLAAVLAVIGQVGDLYESAAKRRHGIKDSSSIIPGHGGIMDRIDALLVVSAAAMLVGIARSGLSGAARGLLIW